ncbi:MAG: hypothetical protein ACE5HK_06450 [Candidatus Methylomirabilales bacterium]
MIGDHFDFLTPREGISRVRIFGFWPDADDPFASHFTIWIHEFLGDQVDPPYRFRAIPMAGLKPANLEFHGEGQTMEDALAKAVTAMRGKSMKAIFAPPPE